MLPVLMRRRTHHLLADFPMNELGPRDDGGMLGKVSGPLGMSCCSSQVGEAMMTMVISATSRG